MNKIAADFATPTVGLITRSPLWIKIALGIFVALLVVWLARGFGDRLPALEAWTEAQGVWAYVIFVGMVVVFTSMFVPDTVFALGSGAMFGVAKGTLVMTIGCLLAAVVNYTLGRWLFQRVVSRILVHNPRLAAMEQAVHREGFRFQFLLRLTPLNPVTVSYVLGATKARFPTFLAACTGLIPALLVEVYFGYVAKHVAGLSGQTAEQSNLHTVMTIVGLLLCVAMLLYIIHVARRALANSDPQAGKAITNSETNSG